LFVRREVEIPLTSLGSGYGEWTIAPDLVEAGDLAFCFGLGEEISFEKSLAERFRMRVHGFDPTPRALQWASSCALPESMHVHGIGLADFDGDLSFGIPNDPRFVSMSAARGALLGQTKLFPVRTLISLHNEFGQGAPISILKMDIEGSEYSVIENIVGCELRPLQIAIEFHHRFPEFGAADTFHGVASLRRAGYVVAHVSPSGEEFLFVQAAALDKRPSNAFKLPTSI
jgi:FkbM family methyltransferase